MPMVRSPTMGQRERGERLRRGAGRKLDRRAARSLLEARTPPPLHRARFHDSEP